MKLIKENAWQYLSVKLPAIGAFILLVLIPALQWGIDFKIIPTEYHAIITGVVMVWLSWIGRKIYQPSLHNNALGFVTVAAGHSNSDPGAVNGQHKEAELVTRFRNAVAHYLREANLEIKTDGTGTKNDPLSAAVKLIKGSSVAVEFHMNAASSQFANGIETIALPSDKKLAQELSKAVADAFGSRLRGDAGWIDQSKSARGKLAFVQNGGLIVELGFISNADELDAFNRKYWQAARAVADVLIKYEKAR